MAGATPLLEAQGLALDIGGDRPPLAGPVDLMLRSGDVLSVRGPSGSGKSTLLRCLVLLEARARGRVRYRGEVIAGGAVPSFRRQVVYLPQTSPRVPMTTTESLRHSFRFASASGEWDPGAASALCERLVLDAGVGERMLPELSGGELQRVALVRALMVAPTVLLMDEPTSALDGVARGAMADVVGEWLVGGDRALLIVSHTDDEMTALVTRRAQLDGGTLTETEP